MELYLVEQCQIFHLFILSNIFFFYLVYLYNIIISLNYLYNVYQTDNTDGYIPTTQWNIYPLNWKAFSVDHVNKPCTSTVSFFCLARIWQSIGFSKDFGDATKKKKKKLIECHVYGKGMVVGISYFFPPLVYMYWNEKELMAPGVSTRWNINKYETIGRSIKPWNAGIYFGDIHHWTCSRVD